MPRNRAGFTVVELLIVVVMMGILTSIALPKYGATRDKAKLAAVRSDVRNAEFAEEAYFSDYGTYGDFADLQMQSTLKLSSGTTMTILPSSSGYTVQATNSSVSAGPASCQVRVGGGAPMTLDGNITCP